MSDRERYIFGLRTPRNCRVTWLFLGCLYLLFLSCQDNRHPYARFDPPVVGAVEDSNAIYAVVEVPAGTTTLQQLDTVSGEIVPLANGDIDFLPAPGNVGFISSTLHTENARPIGAIVLMHALAEGSVVAVLPVGVIQLNEDGRLREIVVAVPSDPDLQSIKVTRFVDFITEYESARYILQEWFVNHKGFGALTLVGWQDERYAVKLINAHRIQPG